jgi:hypothetical protein
VSIIEAERCSPIVPALVAGVAAVAVTVTLGAAASRLSATPDLWVGVSDDAYTLLTRAAPASGAEPLLAVGTGGGRAAITYLKFRVGALPGGVAPRRAELRLTRAGGPLPPHVELVRVPSNQWVESSLTVATAPRLGTVVGTASPDPLDGSVAFDVTRVVRAIGTYSFAVTAPAGDGLALFLAREADKARSSLQRPALLLSAVDRAVPKEPLSDSPPASAGPSPAEEPSTVPGCALGEHLVPTCGVLWGVAPGAHTGTPRPLALREFEERTGRRQAVYHAYHRGTDELFPTDDEWDIAREPGNKRILFLNWKPTDVSWADIARGDPTVDSYLDRLAEHIRATFPDPFFFTVHHEPENDVRSEAGSGWTAADYAAMFRHVIQRLRGNGVQNLVSVVAFMAYIPWNAQPWFDALYPGDDVVDWVAWDAYAYSDPGYGHGDFAELMNRRAPDRPGWPGFYNWAAFRFPDKPLMIAEWGVWYSPRNAGHKPYFYRTVAEQIQLFPRIKALVYFDTPGNQKGKDSRVDSTIESLEAYRRLGAGRTFQVRIA